MEIFVISYLNIKPVTSRLKRWKKQLTDMFWISFQWLFLLFFLNSLLKLELIGWIFWIIHLYLYAKKNIQIIICKIVELFRKMPQIHLLSFEFIFKNQLHIACRRWKLKCCSWIKCTRNYNVALATTNTLQKANERHDSFTYFIYWDCKYSTDTGSNDTDTGSKDTETWSK